MSSNFVANLFKDREGTIWVTTDKGLNRLQKQFIKSYSVADGLIYNEVYPLLQTRNGAIYIGTTQGLSRFSGGKFENLPLKNESGEKISVTSLYEDDQGRLWIGAVGDLHILENGRLKTVSGFFKNTVWAIKNDREGNIWVGSSKVYSNSAMTKLSLNTLPPTVCRPMMSNLFTKTATVRFGSELTADLLNLKDGKFIILYDQPMVWRAIAFGRSTKTRTELCGSALTTAV